VLLGGEFGARRGVRSGAQFGQAAGLAAEQGVRTVDNRDALLGELGCQLAAEPGLVAMPRSVS
jgi:hypothetical protein